MPNSVHPVNGSLTDDTEATVNSITDFIGLVKGFDKK